MNYVLWGKVNFVVNNRKFEKLYNLLFKGWFRITGRSSRLEYISRFILMWLVMFISSFIEHLWISLDTTTPNIVAILFVVLILLVVLVLILSVLQMFFVTHRRLHDLNASGWWQLITFIPCGQLLMIGFIFYKGTPTTNKYGEPPIY